MGMGYGPRQGGRSFHKFSIDKKTDTRTRNYWPQTISSYAPAAINRIQMSDIGCYRQTVQE